MTKIIARIKGGLGNQLFSYAAARRLVLTNQCELVIDNVTGFKRDKAYQRQYALDHFNIKSRKARFFERMEPFERLRRGIKKWQSRKLPFEQRVYLEQEGINFDSRLLSIKVKKTLYLDGLWQSEKYFKDIESTIRDDLKITPPSDLINQQFSKEIQSHSNAVAVHVRWFDLPGSVGEHNISTKYYQQAINILKNKLNNPYYFIFSDNVEAAKTLLKVPEERVKFVTHNQGPQMAYADLWLMTQCQHFITANSTFSWWGAWLSTAANKIVITPALQLEGKTAWAFEGLIPENWLTLKV